MRYKLKIWHYLKGHLVKTITQDPTMIKEFSDKDGAEKWVEESEWYQGIAKIVLVDKLTNTSEVKVCKTIDKTIY